ncbi:hypothetical protein M513_08755 [Trichuris suis]|uniref:Uncharacterized protein n=1 Tax=Trichuris suis TaxID=68888 RepID=A0A085LZH7_9BILA|nr:hypothetical protein M513_08755 [Trichuris suis]
MDEQPSRRATRPDAPAAQDCPASGPNVGRCRSTLPMDAAYGRALPAATVDHLLEAPVRRLNDCPLNPTP